MYSFDETVSIYTILIKGVITFCSIIDHIILLEISLLSRNNCLPTLIIHRVGVRTSGHPFQVRKRRKVSFSFKRVTRVTEGGVDLPNLQAGH